MTSKRSHNLIKLLMLKRRINSTKNQFTKISEAYNVPHLMIDKNLKLQENDATHLRDSGDVSFYLSARAL